MEDNLKKEDKPKNDHFLKLKMPQKIIIKIKATSRTKINSNMAMPPKKDTSKKVNYPKNLNTA